MANGYYIRYALPTLFYPPGPVNWLLVGTLNGKRLLNPLLPCLPGPLNGNTKTLQTVTVSVTGYYAFRLLANGNYIRHCYGKRLLYPLLAAGPLLSARPR